MSDLSLSFATLSSRYDFAKQNKNPALPRPRRTSSAAIGLQRALRGELRQDRNHLKRSYATQCPNGHPGKRSPGHEGEAQFLRWDDTSCPCRRIDFARHRLDSNVLGGDSGLQPQSLRLEVANLPRTAPRCHAPTGASIAKELTADLSAQVRTHLPESRQLARCFDQGIELALF